MSRLDTFKNYKHPPKSIAVVFLLLGVPIAALAQPLEVAQSTVENCRYVDRVEASSGYGKKVDWQSYAKNSALVQAEQLGASHVVWESFNPVGAFNGIAAGKAYNCSYDTADSDNKAERIALRQK